MVLPPRARDQLTRTPTPCMKNLLWSCWSGMSIRLPKYYRLLLVPVVPPHAEGKSLVIKTPCTADTGPRGF